MTKIIFVFKKYKDPVELLKDYIGRYSWELGGNKWPASRPDRFVSEKKSLGIF